MVRRLSLTCVLIFMAAYADAYAAGMEIAIGGWRQAMSGTLGYQAVSDLDIIDLEKDVDFDEETRMAGRAKIDTPLFFPNIYLIGAPMEFEGAGTKSALLNFGDFTFDFSAGLTSKITVNQYDVGFYYGLPFVQTGTMGGLNVDLGINIRIMDLEASIKGVDANTGFTVEESESITVPVPMLYIGVQFMPVHTLSFEAEGRGIAVGDNKVYSLLGRVRYNFAGPVFLAAGYRFDKLEIDEDDLVADIEFQGPFVELGLKF